MKASSQDLRQRLLQTVEEGKTQAQAASLFQVSETTVKRDVRQRREKGHVQPKPIPGRPPSKRAPLEAQLQPQLESQPEATLQEPCDTWEAKAGIKVSISTRSRALGHLKWTRKKKSFKKVERKEEERRKWREQAKELDARKFVLLDESGSTMALTRLSARAPKGKRARGSLPRHRGKK